MHWAHLTRSSVLPFSVALVSPMTTGMPQSRKTLRMALKMASTSLSSALPKVFCVSFKQKLYGEYTCTDAIRFLTTSPL